MHCTVAGGAALAVLCGCLLVPVPCALVPAALSHRCIHDEINDRRASVTQQHKWYARTDKRTARSIECTAPEVGARDRFQGLRINITYDDMETFFPNAINLQKVRTQLANAVKQLSATLAVYPVIGNLVLPRLTDCSHPSQDGCACFVRPASPPAISCWAGAAAPSSSVLLQLQSTSASVRSRRHRLLLVLLLQSLLLALWLLRIGHQAEAGSCACRLSALPCAVSDLPCTVFAHACALAASDFG